LTYKEGFLEHKSTYRTKNDFDTTGWHGGAEKIAEKGASRRLEAYSGVSKNIIP
jgi:hypothetical protein